MNAKPSPVLLVLMCVVTAVGPGSMQIFPPALPLIEQDLAAPPAVIQMAISLSSMAIALSTLIYGPYSDRYGRKPVLLVGMALFAGGGALAALAPDVWTLVLGRVLQAAGGAAGVVVATAAVRDLFDEGRAAEMLAYLMTALAVAPMIAPSIGGAIAAEWGWRPVFWLGAAIGAVLLLVLPMRFEETLKRPQELPSPRNILRAFAALWSKPEFRRYALFVGFATGIFYAFVTGAPYVMSAGFGVDPLTYGVWFMAGPASFMTGNLIAGRIGRRMGVDVMILMGASVATTGCVLGLGLTLLGLASPFTIFGAMAFTGLGQGLAMASAMAGAINVDPERAGAAAGLSGALHMAMAGVAAQIAGMAQTSGFLSAGAPTPTQSVMLVCALCCWVVWAPGALRRRRALASAG